MKQSANGIKIVRPDTGKVRIYGLQNRLSPAWDRAYAVQNVGVLTDDEWRTIYYRLMVHEIYYPTSFESAEGADYFSARDDYLAAHPELMIEGGQTNNDRADYAA